jgi:hypothetical protein
MVPIDLAEAIHARLGRQRRCDFVRINAADLPHTRVNFSIFKFAQLSAQTARWKLSTPNDITRLLYTGSTTTKLTVLSYPNKTYTSKVSTYQVLVPPNASQSPSLNFCMTTGKFGIRNDSMWHFSMNRP